MSEYGILRNEWQKFVNSGRKWQNLSILSKNYRKFVNHGLKMSKLVDSRWKCKNLSTPDEKYQKFVDPGWKIAKFVYSYWKLAERCPTLAKIGRKKIIVRLKASHFVLIANLNYIVIFSKQFKSNQIKAIHRWTGYINNRYQFSLIIITNFGLFGTLLINIYDN